MEAPTPRRKTHCRTGLTKKGCITVTAGIHYAFVRKHNGHLTARTEPDSDTLFTL